MKSLRCCTGGQLTCLPCDVAGVEFSRALLRTSTESYPLCFGSSNAFCLTGSNELTFSLGNVGQQLQDYICNERTGEISPLSGIQQWHIENNDTNLLLFCDDTPLLNDFIVL